jgi:hypothetical protein
MNYEIKVYLMTLDNHIHGSLVFYGKLLYFQFDTKLYISWDINLYYVLNIKLLK